MVARERGGFNKLGGPKDEVQDLDLGLPQVQMKTLETVKFMCKDRLNASVTLDDMADFFKPCTAVKIKEWTTHNPYLLGQRNRKTQRP